MHYNAHRVLMTVHKLAKTSVLVDIVVPENEVKNHFHSQLRNLQYFIDLKFIILDSIRDSDERNEENKFKMKMLKI